MLVYQRVNHKTIQNKDWKVETISHHPATDSGNILKKKSNPRFGKKHSFKKRTPSPQPTQIKRDTFAAGFLLVVVDLRGVDFLAKLQLDVVPAKGHLNARQLYQGQMSVSINGGTPKSP